MVTDYSSARASESWTDHSAVPSVSPALGHLRPRTPWTCVCPSLERRVLTREGRGAARVLHL